MSDEKCRWEHVHSYWWMAKCIDEVWSDYRLGSPGEAGYRYCPSCGKPIEAVVTPVDAVPQNIAFGIF